MRRHTQCADECPFLRVKRTLPQHLVSCPLTRPRADPEVTFSKEPPSAMSAAKSAGVRGGVEAIAFAGTETPPNWAGEEEGNALVLNASLLDSMRACWTGL